MDLRDGVVVHHKAGQSLHCTCPQPCGWERARNHIACITASHIILIPYPLSSAAAHPAEQADVAVVSGFGPGCICSQLVNAAHLGMLGMQARQLMAMPNNYSIG